METRQAEGVGAITCGSFSAIPVENGRYRFSCTWLPDWEPIQSCNQAEARRAVIDLQSKNRRVS